MEQSARFVIPQLLFVVLLGAVAHAQFPPQIQHVVIIFQENRTPDNLFHDLHGHKGSNQVEYDIQDYWVDADGTHKPLTPVGLATNFDLNHGHNGFVSESNTPATALLPICDGNGPSQAVFGCTPSTWNQFMYVDNTQPLVSSNLYGKNITTHVLDPYIAMAKQWGWSNYMYQTNQGPSYPAHQFIFGGTSARSKSDDEKGTFVSENFAPATAFAGCLAQTDATNFLIDSSGTETIFGGKLGDFCYSHDSMATLLDRPAISWKYYAPVAGSIWTAPSSIKSICEPNSDFTVCNGADWANVIFPFTSGYGAVPFLNDLQNCQLPAVSWVIPDGKWSDHAASNLGLGPSYVAAIVNAIGGFNNNCGYWNKTAIIVTWDDWGGWYDHEAAWKLAPPYSNYNYGFRVPLIVISAYTTPGLVSTVQPEDFGSILNMMQGIFFGADHEQQLGFADARSSSDLREFFTETTAQPYGAPIPAVEDIDYFLGLPAPKGGANQAVPPDND